MRKGFLITAGSCALALFSFVFISLALTGSSGSPPPSENAAPREAIAVGTEPRDIQAASRYVVKEYEGYIAVFMPPDFSRPVDVTDIMTTTLRFGDREQLLLGIPVASEDELARLLEDFAP